MDVQSKNRAYGDSLMLSVFPQAAGTAGVAQTLNRMAALVNGALLDPTLRDQAAAIIAGCPKGHIPCQCAAVLAWVNRKVRYVADPRGIETLHDPRIIAAGIRNRTQVYGDCDDLSMYLAALLKTVGLAPRFRAVGYNGRNFSHVYVVCENIILDPTRDVWTVTLTPFRETAAIEQLI